MHAQQLTPAQCKSNAMVSYALTQSPFSNSMYIAPEEIDSEASRKMCIGAVRQSLTI